MTKARFTEEFKEEAVPGMPVGTPGMKRGNTVQSHNVISFDEQGNMEVFAEH
ncbi:MAG: hypothetical protein ACYTBY_07075 [Planctomycetota bacterium]|jgi:hypothetical protein